VPSPVVDWMNKWRKEESAQGIKAALGMREIYLEVRQMVSEGLMYSKSVEALPSGCWEAFEPQGFGLAGGRLGVDGVIFG
jgi:hypothetical protein